MWQITIKQAFSINFNKRYLFNFSYNHFSFASSFSRRTNFHIFHLTQLKLRANISEFIMICMPLGASSVCYFKASKHFDCSHKIHTLKYLQKISQKCYYLLCVQKKILPFLKTKKEKQI